MIYSNIYPSMTYVRRRYCLITYWYTYGMRIMNWCDYHMCQLYMSHASYKEQQRLMKVDTIYNIITNVPLFHTIHIRNGNIQFSVKDKCPGFFSDFTGNSCVQKPNKSQTKQVHITGLQYFPGLWSLLHVHQQEWCKLCPIIYPLFITDGVQTKMSPTISFYGMYRKSFIYPRNRTNSE